MSLTDQEILELSELCNAVVDGTISEKQKERLARWLAESEDARRFYVRALGLSASLFTYASEMQSEAPDALPQPGKITRLNAYRWVGALAAAASIALLVWISSRAGHNDTTARAKAGDFVARLTASKECKWLDGYSPAQGENLQQGRRLDLAGGKAEITFDCGAQVVLVGPASLEINSAWDATLRQGTIKASVPPEAIGFRISNPAVDVVDLGTEFTMTATAGGTAEVLVLKGEVEADPGTDTDEQTIVLHAKEARRFDSSGVSSVDDSEKKFAQWTTPMHLDHFVPATADYVHWSFDEAGGNVLKADAFGMPLGAYDARLEGEPAAALDAMRTEGRWQGALKFDGIAFAKAPFPDISGNRPHTVAFWVNVPADAQLSESYAMVAWGTTTRKLGSHPVHICWNRNPVEGTVGALRTDYGGGFALGTTSLRDGRWHHVAVVFVPGEDEHTAVEVKQYVDGRFEGEGNPSPPGKRNGPANSHAETPEPVNDLVWLGCRLGSNGQKRDRFRGEMDELCIADRALEPREIVDLMKNNQPPQPVLAALKR